MCISMYLTSIILFDLWMRVMKLRRENPPGLRSNESGCNGLGVIHLHFSMRRIGKVLTGRLTTMYSVTQCSEPIQCSDLYGGSGSARSSADVHIRQGYTVCEKDGASESARQR